MYAAQMRYPEPSQVKQIAERIVEFVSTHQADRPTAKSVIEQLANGDEKDDVSKALRTVLQSGDVELADDMSLRPAQGR